MIRVDVYEDYDGFNLVDEDICDVGSKDWENLVDFILQVKGIKPESIRGDIVIEVYGACCHNMFELPDDRVYEIPDNLTYFSLIVKTADNKALAYFDGIEAVDVEGQTREQAEKLELYFKKFLIKAKGAKFADVIIEELKKKERQKIKTLKKQTLKQIKEVESLVPNLEL